MFAHPHTAIYMSSYYCISRRVLLFRLLLVRKIEALLRKRSLSDNLTKVLHVGALDWSVACSRLD
jgi:hypothetical protein